MRPTRIDHPNAVHHLTCRVNWQVFHLHQPEHADVYFRVVRSALEELDVALLGFALMSNHHHLVFRVPADAPYLEHTSRRTRCRHRRRYPHGHPKRTVIAQFAHRIHRNVAREIQKELGVTGHFWERRYFAREVQGPHDLATTIAYNHRNPVRPGLVLLPEDYPWSSAAAYVGDNAASALPLAPDHRLPFDLDWAKLRDRVVEYQATKALDDVYRALAKKGISPWSPDYERILGEFLERYGQRAVRPA